MVQRRRIIVALAAITALVGILYYSPPAPVLANTLPVRLDDREFWHLVTDFSEPNGYFRSDNFLSNERAYQRVIPALTARLQPGGVYLGVGPEQNFTYIAAIRPKLAFIVDIRRGNLDEHLLYKAFIEMSADRADFLSRLFARPKPTGLGTTPSVDALMAAFEAAEPSQALFDENLQAATDWLQHHHGFALTDDDVRGLEYVYRAFFESGPGLNYSFLPGGGFGRGMNFPTYAELMTATDEQGDRRSYLASEDNFRILSELESNNAIIPIVGNFAGPKALRAVASYLRDHHATVSAMYTSNVEMYLFQQVDDWKQFYGSVATLPVNGASTFIRSVSNRGRQFRTPNTVPGALASTRLCSIADLVNAYRAGSIGGYNDVIAMSK